MQICYEYAGLGRALTWLLSSDGAAWVGALGTLVAVWSAFALYRQTRNDAKADERERRKVLHAVVRDYIRAAADDVSRNAELLRSTMNAPGMRPLLAGIVQIVKLPGQDRMFELQQELVGFGHPDDVAVASFIETCRVYEDRRRRLASAVELVRARPADPVVEDLCDAAASGLTSQAEIAASKAKDAIAEIQRFEMG